MVDMGNGLIEHGNLKLYNADNMDILKEYEDNYFDLAIVDPPYGCGDVADFAPKRKGGVQRKVHENKNWNDAPPTKEYFIELIRVSKDQIIWGANHYPEHLYSSRGWIFWDKIYENTFNFSAGELAFTSFDRILKKFTLSARWIPNTPLNIHPTQKPIELYNWVLENYSKPENKILDTHLGSGSNAIANYYFKSAEFVGIELDKDYFDKSIKRIERETAQQTLF